MKDGTLCIKGLSVSIVVRSWVESLCELVLGLWGKACLVLEHHYVGMVESVSDYLEVGIGEVLEVDIVNFDTKVDGRGGRRGLKRANFEGLDCHCVV
jgi:hypothetical protein